METSPYILAALAAAAIEGLDAVGVRPPFTETDDFVSGCVLDSRGRRWVVKSPRNVAAATMLEAEVALAPSLIEELRGGNLPFDIVRPAGFAPTREGGRAVVYPEPFGLPSAFEHLSKNSIRELARAIASIHLLSPEVISRAGLPVYSASDCRKRLVADLKEAHNASPLPMLLLRRWENALEDLSLWDFSPVVVHGDVASENFLWREKAIATVCGFGEAHVGDPATDLAPLLALGDEFFDRAKESYENTREVNLDRTTLARTQLLSELAIVRWLRFGLRTSNPEIIADARQMLEDLASEIEADPELNPGPTWNTVPGLPDTDIAAEFVPETSATAASTGEDIPVSVAEPTAPTQASPGSLDV